MLLKGPSAAGEENVKREKRRLEYSDDKVVIGTAGELANSFLSE